MFDDATLLLAQKLVEAAKKSGLKIVTAESCTGGLIAGALTAVPGSSEVVYGGFVTYANGAKISMLGVPKTLIDQYGAVSEQVARAMARGALARSGTGIAIAVTGVAGPGGGTKEKPVGLVCFASATAHDIGAKQVRFGAIGRDRVRLATVNTALAMALETLTNHE